LRDAPDGRVHYYSIIKFVGEKDGQTLRSPDESILLSSSSNGNHRLEIRCGEGCIYWVTPLSWDFARQPMNAAAPPFVSTGGGAAHGVTLNPNLIL
jgi:hypothetical protein